MWEHVPERRGTADVKEFQTRYNKLPKAKTGLTLKHLFVIVIGLMIAADLLGDVIWHKWDKRQPKNAKGVCCTNTKHA